MNKKIILASASPRRRELLTQIGLDFDVVVSETEEKITSTEPAKVVEELSAQKAEAVWEKFAVSGVCEPERKSGETTMTDTLVLGADTVVACDGKILGKPADTEAAAAMWLPGIRWTRRAPTVSRDSAPDISAVSRAITIMW